MLNYRKKFRQPFICKPFIEQIQELKYPNPNNYENRYTDEKYKSDENDHRNKIKELINQFKETLIKENGLEGNEKASLLYDLCHQESFGDMRSIENRFKLYCVLLK